MGYSPRGRKESDMTERLHCAMLCYAMMLVFLDSSFSYLHLLEAPRFCWLLAELLLKPVHSLAFLLLPQ